MTEMVKTKVNGKYEIILPKHRADRPEWYTEAGWERARLDAMREVIGKGDVVYYVGAEEGEFPALCQMWGAKVVLIEPNPKAWPNMKAIWDANGLDMPHGCFEGFASNVTSAHSRNQLLQSWPNHADGIIVGDHGFKELYLEADNYDQIKLVDIATSGLIEHPSVIIFDCEGSEWQVLKGAQPLLELVDKPILFASIHPEFMFHQWGQYQRELRDWIIDFGYDEHILDYQHELHTMYTPRES